VSKQQKKPDLVVGHGQGAKEQVIVVKIEPLVRAEIRKIIHEELERMLRLNVSAIREAYK
jgi:hypothetical protein